MAWPTRPYVPSRTGPADGDQLHPETLVKDGLLRALSLWETDLNFALSPLRDDTSTLRTGPH